MPIYDNATLDGYAEQFKSGFELMLQQKQSKFQPHVMTTEPVKGTGATIANYIQPFEASVGGDDMGDTEWVIPEFNTRWVFPKKIRVAVPVTTDDVLYTLEDPSNPLIQATYAAMQRAMDRDIIIPCFFRDVVAGPDKDKTFTFDTTNHVIGEDIGGTDTGINYHKLTAARRIFLENEVDLDMEEAFIGISPQQEEWALHMAEAKNDDYRNLGIRVNDKGQLVRLGTFTPIVSNRLTTVATNVLACPVWVRSGVGLTTWMNPSVKLDYRADKNYTLQLFCEMRAGATRMEEGKVLQMRTQEVAPVPAAG